MAMFQPIPLPGIDNPQFKDVMDYLETIQKRKGEEGLEKQRLDELAKYHQQSLAQQGALNPLKMELLRQKIEDLKNPKTKLSPQERTQAMKLLDAGRTLQGVATKSIKLTKLLKENPNLTGWLPALRSAVGKGGGKLGEFGETAGNLQTDFARLASQRGGAQVLRMVGKIKPSELKDVASNLGYTNSIYENGSSDFNDIKKEYETLTGNAYPLEFPKMEGNNPPGTSIMYKSGNEYHIPNEEVEEAKKNGYSNER